MERSTLSQFLVMMRQKRGSSVGGEAKKLNMPILEYALIEEQPEIAPVHRLYQIFVGLSLSEPEYLDLCFLIQHIYSSYRPGVMANLDATLRELFDPSRILGWSRHKEFRRQDVKMNSTFPLDFSFDKEQL